MSKITQSKLKNAALMTAMYSMFSNTFPELGSFNDPEESSPQVIAMRKGLAKLKQNESKGLKLFEYGEGKFIWALNKENANRKAKKKNWI